MIQLNSCEIEKLIINQVGNKSYEEGVRLSSNIIRLDDLLCNLLVHYFLKPFVMNETYVFYHSLGLNYNGLYNEVSKIFDKAEPFEEIAKNITLYLYEKSNHPKIKSGEFYVVYFKYCVIDNETVDAIGLFKSENKDTFIQINAIDGGFSVESQSGININKLDKGCLIFNTHKEDGYAVSVVDNSNRGEAKYWVEDFLQVKRKNDSYNQTQNAVALCKGFISQLPGDVAKSDKAVMMNRVMEGMKSENVILDELAAHAFGQDIASSGFKAFKDDYEAAHDVRFDESFQSKPEAIKRRATGTMTTIKLDKNFDVNIHGGEQYIERGYDEGKGMRYYKLYFNEEK